jgi:4-alpha-glucanotransferase
VKLPRSSGIFLHPTSLPDGRLGDGAYRFVDWLAAAEQSWWQVLPLGPPDEFGSPYRTTSAFAGSPRLLAEPDAPVSQDELEDFVARHPYWIGEWARFAGAGAIADQVRFEREWNALRAYARERGVRLVGDVPIYVSDIGSDVEAWPELFAEGEVAGVPPDALSANGQHWGNPLYAWPAHRATGYRWWTERVRRVLELVDISRIDHFRGFVSYWAIPESHKSARRGTWKRGPGAELFLAVEDALGELPVIAEDLGVITPAVRRLRDELGLPGMAVLLWAFGGSRDNPHALRNHRENQVVYTSTHDTDTVVGWFASLKKRERDATGLDPREPHWGLIELAMGSRAELAMIPAQDVLGLGSEARMNRPGEVEGNWSWRLERGQLTERHAARLREATARGARTAIVTGS